MTEKKTEAPATYDGFIDYIMSIQDPLEPAFKLEREAREWAALAYPGLEQNYARLRAAATAHGEKVI